MSCLTTIERHPVTRWIAIILMVFGVLSFLEDALGIFDILPGYRVSRVRKNRVRPDVYLFPAQKVRLSPNFFDGTQDTEVQAITWSLKKAGNTKFRADGLHPTIVVPEGGIYQLDAAVRVNNEVTERTGSANLYVVQDEPVQTSTSGATALPLQPTDLPKGLIEKAMAAGIQVYDGNSNWRTVQSATITNGLIQFDKNTKIPVIDGKVLFRALGAVEDLSNYGTVHVIEGLRPPIPAGSTGR